MIWILDKTLEKGLLEIAQESDIDPDALLDRLVRNFIESYDEETISSMLWIVRPDGSIQN